MVKAVGNDPSRERFTAKEFRLPKLSIGNRDH